MFDFERLEGLFAELARRLQEKGIDGQLLVVGGAAMILLGESRHATFDIDGLLTPRQDMLSAAKAMSEDLAIPVDWLSDAVSAYVPFLVTDEWTEVSSRPGLSVYVASPELLLAMKLKSNRGVRDTEDIELLLSRLSITKLDEVEAIYEKYHAQEVLSPQATIRVEEWLSKKGRQG